jgi:ZIP family zinc transporter
MVEIHGSFLQAVLLTLFAGLATGVGSFVAMFAKKQRTDFLSVGLGFSAGVMIYVSFMELLVHSGEMLGVGADNIKAGLIRMAGFFGGLILAAVIDAVIPEDVNPHECAGDTNEEIEACTRGHGHKHGQSAKSLADAKLARMGFFAALAIAIHNFPEGFATFAAALKDPGLGISIAVAIAIHNIPEGMSVAIPIYYATGSRMKAFMYSFLSGLAEPVGAVIGYLILRPFLSDTVFGIIFAAVAGIMVYISFDELLPAARRYGKGHIVIIGVALGMAVMALALDVMGHAH